MTIAAKQKKIFVFRTLVLSLSSLIFVLGAAANAVARAERAPKSRPGDFGQLRVENENNFLVPHDAAAAVWRFLDDNFNNNKNFLAKIDPRLSTTFAEESFIDDYFDTPSLAVLAKEGGLRHRYRLNFTNPADQKSGRELVQIKISNIGDDQLSRGEIKFEVQYPGKVKSAEDSHPLLGLIKRSERPQFKELFSQAGVNPLALRPILTSEQRRRRIYLSLSGQPFMTLSFDEVKVNKWWAKISYTNLEAELNEITYTKAAAAGRETMRVLAAKVVGKVAREFPELTQDLTPKYKKSFNLLAGKIPFLRFWIRIGLI